MAEGRLGQVIINKVAQTGVVNNNIYKVLIKIGVSWHTVLPFPTSII